MMQLISLLLQRIRRNPASGRGLSDGFSRGALLRLPAGQILAEEGVSRGGRSVMPVCEEAYVVIRLNRSTHCYATWYPVAARWELQHIEAGRAAPAKTRT